MLVPASLRAPLEAFSARVRDVFGERVHEMRLFGSYARGEADEYSDVDVLVVIDGLTDLEIALVANEAAVVIVATGSPLAPLPMSTAHLVELRRVGRQLAMDLDRDGISL